MAARTTAPPAQAADVTETAEPAKEAAAKAADAGVPPPAYP